MAAASGIYGQTMTEFEPRRIANPIRAYKARRALEAEGFDILAFEEAQAIFGDWRSVTQSVPPAILMAVDGPVVSSKPSATIPGLPIADVWLVEALTPRITALTAAEERAGRTAKVVERVRLTDDLLNKIYEAYEADPAAQYANLQGAMCLHVQNRFANKLGRLMGGDSAVEPQDVLADFVMDILSAIESGKYLHSGKFAHWIGRLWSNFRSKAVEKVFDEANRSIGLNMKNQFDEYGDERMGRNGRLNPVDVDMQQVHRDTESLNDIPSQVARLVRMLDDPDTEIGQMDEVTKSVIRALVKGESKKAVAKKHKVTSKTIGRWLEQLKPLRQTVFVTSDDIRKNVLEVSQ